MVHILFYTHTKNVVVQMDDHIKMGVQTFNTTFINLFRPISKA